jgi:hypothetical protein
MITVEEATEVLYRVLRTDPYRARAYWTMTAYKADPLYTTPKQPFTLDPTLHPPKQSGPAA